MSRSRMGRANSKIWCNFDAFRRHIPPLCLSYFSAAELAKTFGGTIESGTINGSSFIWFYILFNCLSWYAAIREYEIAVINKIIKIKTAIIEIRVHLNWNNNYHPRKWVGNKLNRCSSSYAIRWSTTWHVPTRFMVAFFCI